MNKGNLSEQKRVKAEWKRVRKRLAEFPQQFYPEKTIQMLDLCTQSEKLKNLVPYVSLGRLCLNRNKVDDIYAQNWNDCPCMYFHNNQYTASSYDNMDKYFFENAKDAIEFVEQNIPMSIKQK